MKASEEAIFPSKKVAYPTMNLLFKSFQCLGYTIPSRLQKIDKNSEEIYLWLNKKRENILFNPIISI